VAGTPGRAVHCAKTDRPISTCPFSVLQQTPRHPRWNLSARLLAALVVAVCAAAPAHAQRLQFRGNGEPDLDRQIRRVLAQPDYLHISSDTVIGAGQTVPASLVITRATVTIEGTVRGDVLGVDANVFIRPGARIEGQTLNAAGGLYRSELASFNGDVANHPLAPYRVVREADAIWIEGFREPASLIALDGAFGFVPATYDRVNGLTARWGAALVLPMAGTIEPELRGQVSYRTESQRFGGRLELALIRRGSMLLVGADRDVLSSDRWIRGEISNTLSFVSSGKDYRNLYGADRVYAEFAREFKVRSTLWGASVRAQREDAKSLSTGDPWVFQGPDTLRSNPGINDGRIASAILRGFAGRGWATSALMAASELEFSGEVAGGEFNFGRYVTSLDYAAKAIANHILEIDAYAQGPLPGTDSLPLQRWTFVGGSSTLQTFPIAAFPGDRVVFVRTRYTIPGDRRFRLPLVGAPDISLIHVGGMAWTKDRNLGIEQNSGVQLFLMRVAWVRYFINPSDPGDQNELGFGVSLPRRLRPWERLSEGPTPRIRSRR
jgi:hypothetical protein